MLGYIRHVVKVRRSNVWKLLYVEAGKGTKICCDAKNLLLKISQKKIFPEDNENVSYKLKT